MDATLKNLMKIERRAFKTLLNDPRCLADPTAPHTPELKKAWEDAADAEHAYREAHGLLYSQIGAAA
jgi:hypothetical protein